MTLPARLVADLSTSQLDPSSVEGVIGEATPTVPWIVSVNRDVLPDKGAYATIRPRKVSFFDTFDDALADAGGGSAPEATGCYYELVSAIGKPSLDLSFKPPVTFVGQIGDLLFLSVPKNVLTPEQMKGLGGAIKMVLGEAVRAGKIPPTDLRTIVMPDGVDLLRIVEKKS